MNGKVSYTMEHLCDTEENRGLVTRAIEKYDALEAQYGHFMISNGIKIHYLDFGKKDGAVVVWSHPACANGHSMAHLIDPLTNAGFRVIAIDHRGHGKTNVTDYNFDLFDVADDIKGLLDYLSLRKVILAGAFVGATISATFYSKYPEYVSGLLLETGGSFSFKQLENEIKQGVCTTPPEPDCSIKAIERIFCSAGVKSRFEAIQLMLDVDWHHVKYSKIGESELLMWISMLSKNDCGLWGPITTIWGHPFEGSPDPDQKLPQELFASLNVPMHIIDPVSDNDYFPTSHQNRQLKDLHPSLIVHEIYEDTPALAFLSRPERFVKSLKKLSRQIKD